VLFSPAWKKIVGYADAELPDTLATWHQLIHPEDSSAAPDCVTSFCSRLVGLCEPTVARSQPLTTTADIQGFLGAIMSLPPPFIPSDPPPFILPFAPPAWFL
jgi:hypothetical protein